MRGHPDLNQRPLDLQSNALPLSYTPTCVNQSNLLVFHVVLLCNSFLPTV